VSRTTPPTSNTAPESLKVLSILRNLPASNSFDCCRFYIPVSIHLNILLTGLSLLQKVIINGEIRSAAIIDTDAQ
jgi:hypothetical protein